MAGDDAWAMNSQQDGFTGSGSGELTSGRGINDLLALDACIVGVGDFPFVHHDPAPKTAVLQHAQGLCTIHAAIAATQMRGGAAVAQRYGLIRKMKPFGFPT